MGYNYTPDQIVVSEGVQTETELRDLDGDTRYELVIPMLKLGLLRIIKMLLTKKANVDVLFYRMDQTGRYPEIPTLKRRVTFEFSFSGGSNKEPIFDVSGDFNGDGLNDLVTSPDYKKLQFFYGQGKKLFKSSKDDEIMTKLPYEGNKLKVIELNGDQKSDLVITYGKKDDKDQKLMKTIRILRSK